MKTFIFLALAFSFSFTQPEAARFVGLWEGEDAGEIGLIHFDEEGYAYFEIEGKILGGKEFVLEGQRGQMTYEVDLSKDPIEVDFILTKLESGDQKTMKCIATFIDDFTLKLASNFNDGRPSEFTKENTILLQKKP